MADNARALVDDILGRKMTREIWSGNYDKVLPVLGTGFRIIFYSSCGFSTCFVSVNAEVLETF